MSMRKPGDLPPKTIYQYRGGVHPADREAVDSPAALALTG
jgi:hypothetical protein